ncbi:hypothetical protein TGAM01_v204681 [Trichoderma gamsii]|uniref:Zn(2)-C6 fungal-type domain-containing protein n=1 Tax=Trichoderma gamsii TaxID=398673 RepID=A0A2P4ZQX1_9HYPO|nr:hypothetical protein TGAM01_v204681 [Trichoderma gamsii]PON26671.1 hypothetical protein TGAM01_v204681 [Trichoderma gamsii]
MADQLSSITEAAPIRDLSTPPLPRAKRRKTQQACSNCRGRKTKCDGQYPICAACERRGVAMTCVYERPQPAPHSQRYADLESRLQRLEQGENSERPSVSLDIRSLQPPRFGPDINLADDDSLPPSNASGIVGHDDSPHNLAHQQVDALATVSPDDNGSCVYGESSTIAFVREFTQKTPSDSTAAQHKHQSGQAAHGSARVQSPAVLTPLDISLGSKDNLAILPRRSNADDFLRCYFEFIHPLFPLLHKDSFIAQYNRLWLPYDNSQSGKEDLVFMCNLNLVFALGCQFSSLAHTNNRASTANQFYKMSRQVLLYDILGTTSVSVVQWLLLSGVYLQSTEYASHCWNSIGLAIRLAQSLGLHLEHPGSKSESQLNREMRRRIWHTCVVLDKLLAMTFGRPAMVNRSYGTPMPSLIDDEYLRTDGDGVQPNGANSRMGLFVYSCKLFEVLDDILSTFYSVDASADPVSESRLQDMVSEVLSFNRRLDNFITSLPDYLRTAQSFQVVMTERNSWTNLQQQVLYCRFLYTKLLSLRPLLLLATKRGPKDAVVASTEENLSLLDDYIISRYCDLCINTAHRLIETIFEHLDTAYKSFGWHSVYFTFAAATILLASMRLPEGNIQTASRAIQVLEALRCQIHGGHPEETDTRSSIDDTPVSDEQMKTEMPLDFTNQLDFSQFNPFGSYNLYDAWFGQHLINLDALEMS